MENSRPLIIATISDHLIGHTRQVEAIVAAIGEVRPVDVVKLRSKRWSPFRSHHVRRLVLALGRPSLLPLLLEGDWRRPFDLVVSGSGSTTTANVLLTRLNDAQNIFTGHIRGIRPGDVDCVYVHRPEHLESPHHVVGPVPVLRQRKPEHPFDTLAGKRVAVVVGGEARGAGFDFDDRYCERLFGRLAAVDAETGTMSWIVATSRRTPPVCYAAIEAFVNSVPRCEFVDFRRAGAGSLALAYESDCVIVTEDSKSMAAEFVSNQFPVVLATVPRTGANVRDITSKVVAEANVQRIAPETIDKGTLEAALLAMTPPTEDIYSMIRRTIATRLPGLFA